MIATSFDIELGIEFAVTALVGIGLVYAIAWIVKRLFKITIPKTPLVWIGIALG